jgi:hypothetical protein
MIAAWQWPVLMPLSLTPLVAAKVAARLATPQNEATDEWMDTRRAAEYLAVRSRSGALAAGGRNDSREIRLLILERDKKFTRDFDAIFASHASGS